MSKLIIAHRGSGKTMNMIYTSATTGIPIVTASELQRVRVEEIAKSMGVKIPYPYTVREIRQITSYKPEQVLVDNADGFLVDAIEHYLGTSVAAITVSVE